MGLTAQSVKLESLRDIYEIEKNDWESKITFIDSINKVSDLLIEKIGLKYSKNYYEKKLYIFKNDKYILKINKEKELN